MYKLAEVSHLNLLQAANFTQFYKSSNLDNTTCPKGSVETLTFPHTCSHMHRSDGFAGRHSSGQENGRKISIEAFGIQ